MYSTDFSETEKHLPKASKPFNKILGLEVDEFTEQYADSSLKRTRLRIVRAWISHQIKGERILQMP